MPRFADGTEARIGDRVRGTGYNLKDKDGKPLEFEGLVVGIVPNSDACNIRVAYLDLAKVWDGGEYEKNKPFGKAVQQGSIIVDSVPVVVCIEYGETRAFRKIA